MKGGGVISLRKKKRKEEKFSKSESPPSYVTPSKIVLTGWGTAKERRK